MKKFLLSKCFVLIMGIFLIISFAGCDKTPSSSTGSQVDLKYLETADYPLQTDQKIKWWSYRGNTVVGKYKDPAQMPWVETYKKLTGVDVEWKFPPAGQEKAQFNLLIASGDIPDIISYYWLGTAEFPGGPDKAIDDGYIAALNDLIPKYAPGFNEYLENNPMASKELKTDGGKYYYIPSYVITEDYYMNNTVGYTSGFMFRKDWLDELGLPIPETISEWYTTLKAFKNKGVENPFTIQSGYLARGLSGPWGLTLGWYHDNNKVKYGYAEPKYKEFLAEMKKWYDEGLLDANFLSIDGQSVDRKDDKRKAGATFGWIGNGLIKWTRAARKAIRKFLLTGVPFPVMNKGDKPVFGSRDPMGY
jgi:putative aldouronate transport system substrate-binding protein